MSARKPASRPLTLMLSIVSLTACYSVASYRGDGRLYDAGWYAVYGRFLLDLGRVETPEEIVRYRLVGLPATELTLGLQIESLSTKEARTEAERLAVTAELRLIDERGEVVIDELAPLAEWVWTGGMSAPDVSYLSDSSFAYRAGRTREVPTKRGGVRSEKVNEKASSGWGTFFHPRTREEYSLEVRLPGGREFCERYEVRVVATG